MKNNNSALKEFLLQILKDPLSWMWTNCKPSRPPYFLLSIYFLGFTNTYLRFSTKEYPIQSNILLLLLLLLAPISGFFDYWIRGGWYHLRVLICGGKSTMRTSLNIYLYSGWPLYIVNSLLVTILIILFGTDILRISFNYPLRELLLSFEMLVTVYTYTISYHSVRLIQDTKKTSSLIFFIFLPFCTTIFWHYMVLLRITH